MEERCNVVYTALKWSFTNRIAAATSLININAPLSGHARTSGDEYDYSYKGGSCVG